MWKHVGYALAVAWLSACGGQGSTPDAGSPDAGLFDAGHAPHDAGIRDAGAHDAGRVDAGAFDAGPPFVPPIGPLLLHDRGGPVLGAAWLVTLAYPGVPDLAEVEALADAIPDSGWLRAVGAEYDVDVIGHSRFDVPLAAPSVFSDDDVSTLIAQGLDAGWWVAPDGGTPIWLVLYPPESTPSVGLFAGEHFDSAGAVEGWVAPHDDAGVTLYEVILTHELIEAATDPFVRSAPAWRVAKPSEPISELYGGSAYTGGEVADLCEILPGVSLDRFTVTRSWSNAASDAGRNPCVPVPPGAVPWVTIGSPLGEVVLSPGQTADLMLLATSTEGGSTWPVVVEPPGGDPLSLDLELLTPVATAGQSVHAEIVTAFDARPGATAVYLLMSVLDGGEPSYTPILLRVRDEP